MQVSQVSAASPAMRSLPSSRRSDIAAKSALWGLLAVSILVHWSFFASPTSVVFDETFWGRVTMMHLRGEFAFDIHPPLARLLFWLTAWAFQLDPTFAFATNGLEFPDHSYLFLRLLPCLAGTALPLVIYGLAGEIGLSRLAALLVGFLVAIDNALIVISRFAMADIFILFFGFAALLAGLRAQRLKSWPLFLLSAVLAGAALSVKWTGASFAAMLGAVYLWQAWRNRSAGDALRLIIAPALIFAVYLGCFAAEFAIGERASPDNAFMSAAFQASLKGTPPETIKGVKPLDFAGKFIEMNETMFDYARNQKAEHAYYSRWYSWPFMMRSLDFWAQYNDPTEAHIFLLGNPAIWWLSGYAALYLLVNFAPKLLALALRQAQVMDRPERFVVAGYLLNMLPFIAIARGMFLYHYLPALIFAILGLGYLVDRSGWPRALSLSIVVAAAPLSLYFMPLTYGFSLSKEAYDSLFWVPGWRV